MMTKYEFADEYERRFDGPLPKWMYDPMAFRAKYLEYCDEWEAKYGGNYDED